jgi:hypothetical protein
MAVHRIDECGAGSTHRKRTRADHEIEDPQVIPSPMTSQVRVLPGIQTCDVRPP